MMAITYQESLPEPESFFGLYETTGWNEEYGLDQDALSRGLAASWAAVSAYDGDRLVGFGRVLSDGVLHALIVEMIVEPAYQGRGIGRHVLEQLLDRCRAHGIRDIQLFCARGKAGFYERFGFVSRPDDAPGMEWKPEGRRLGSAAELRTAEEAR
jgi:GNAT superfamily N-acetyltransferase